MSPRGRAYLTGLAVTALVCLPLLPEILGTRRLVFRDAQITHWPWRRVAMKSLASGSVPFVNASASGGEPLLANPNASLLYPTMLLEKILSPAAAFNLHYLLHVLWAFFGARALARRLGLAPGASFFAAVAFAFSGIMMSYGSAFANSGAAASWLPWCAAATLGLIRAHGAGSVRRASAASAIAFGLQLLAGEPVLSLLTLLFAAFLGAAEIFSSKERLARTRNLLAGGVSAGLLAAALASPLLLPLLAVLPLTYRGQHLYSARAFGASPFAAWRMIEWLFPRFDGDPGALGAGAHWQYALHSGDVVYIWCVTFGVIPLLAIAIAGLDRDFWTRRAVWLAGGALVSLLFAFGSSLLSPALLGRGAAPVPLSDQVLPADDDLRCAPLGLRRRTAASGGPAGQPAQPRLSACRCRRLRDRLSPLGFGRPRGPDGPATPLRTRRPGGQTPSRDSREPRRRRSLRAARDGGPRPGPLLQATDPRPDPPARPCNAAARLSLGIAALRLGRRERPCASSRPGRRARRTRPRLRLSPAPRVQRALGRKRSSGHAAARRQARACADRGDDPADRRFVWDPVHLRRGSRRLLRLLQPGGLRGPGCLRSGAGQPPPARLRRALGLGRPGQSPSLSAAGPRLRGRGAQAPSLGDPGSGRRAALGRPGIPAVLPFRRACAHPLRAFPAGNRRRASRTLGPWTGRTGRTRHSFGGASRSGRRFRRSCRRIRRPCRL